ncbi:MAG: hypothetical protein KGL39_09320 [Patescibacteria group bacterium]|nr:hypothetical protein [Patescibacteria group bacterium]
MANPYEIHTDAPPVRVTSLEAKTQTLDKIIGEGNEIYAALQKDVADKKVAPGDYDGNKKLYESYHEAHKDFGTSFPIVLKTMVFMRKYSTEAFRKYLYYYKSRAAPAGTSTGVFESRDKYLEVQAEYLVFLHKDEAKHYDTQTITNLRQQIVKKLKEEDKEFVETHKEVTEEDEARKTAAARDRRELLYAFVKQRRSPGGRG